MHNVPKLASLELWPQTYTAGKRSQKCIECHKYTYANQRIRHIEKEFRKYKAHCCQGSK